VSDRRDELVAPREDISVAGGAAEVAAAFADEDGAELREQGCFVFG
jgi:hypothetical protein